VELNMLTSGELVSLIESRLAEQGIAKVIPDAAGLGSAYRRAYQVGLLDRALQAAAPGAARQAQAVEPPADLEALVHARLGEHPGEPWDDAVASVALAAVGGETGA